MTDDPTTIETSDLTYFAGSAPHSAEEFAGSVPYLRHMVAVTEEHGLQIATIDEHDCMPYPFRVSGTRTVSELVSFLDELTRRPVSPLTSTLWGDYTTGTVTAVYNEHTSEAAGWRDDLLTLELATDPDWAAWQKISGKWFAQADFGDVIEELLHTVIAPDQADLYEIIHSIRATSSAQFESRIDRSVSAQQLTYTEDIKAAAGGKATGKLEVPKTVTLRLRPWEGHIETYDIDAWFRLHVSAGDLKLTIKLKPHQQILRQAWADMITKIVAHNGIPVLAYRGTR